MNNVLLVAVLHRRYNLYEGKKDKREFRLNVCCCSVLMTVIKDVVEEEEEEEDEMWSTGKITQVVLKTPGG